MKAWPVVVVAWCVVLACAAPVRTAAPPAAPRSVMPPSPRDQIKQLSAEIEQQRAQLGLPEPAAAALTASAAQPMSQAPSSHDPTCHPAASQTCTDSCKLSDDICDNAKTICDLAAQLAGDPWAADKCTQARATCEAAHDRCCACQQ